MRRINKFFCMITAVALIASVIPVSAKNIIEEENFNTGAEKHALDIYTQPIDINVDDEYIIAAEVSESELKDFFNYMPVYGIAYSDIEVRSDITDGQKEECRTLYNELYNASIAFANNYSDVHEYTFSYSDGTTKTEYLLPGSYSIEKTYSLDPMYISEIYYMFRNDHPEFYWLSNTFSCQTLENGEHIPLIRLYEDYILGVNRKASDERMQSVINMYRGNIKDTYTDYQKLRLIHDMIIGNNKYGLDSSNKPLDTPYAHSILGVFDGDAGTDIVCEGYAKAFQLLSNSYDIYNIVVTGLAGVGNLTEDDGHMWNIAAINGVDYYFDLTWDDDNINSVRYFAKGSKSEFLNTHHECTPEGKGTWYLYKLPTVSENDYSYLKSDTVNPPNPFEDQGAIPWEEPTAPPTLKPFDNAESFAVGRLKCELPNIKHFDNYGSFCGLVVESSGVYDSDYTVEYDGERITSAEFKTACYGTFNGKEVDFSKLIIKSEANITFTAQTLYRASSENTYYNDMTLIKTLTVGQPTIMYGDGMTLDKLVDTDKKGHDEFGDMYYLRINIASDNGNAEYGKDYVAAYDGVELPAEIYFRYKANDGNYYLNNNELSDDAITEIIKHITIRPAVDITVTTLPLYTYNGQQYYDEEMTKITRLTISSEETPTATASEAPTEAATEAASEAATEAASESPTEAASESPTKAASEAPTEAASEAPTEVATEAASEAPTEAAGEAPTEAASEAPTASPTPVPQCVNVAIERGEFDNDDKHIDDGVIITLTKDRYLDPDETHVFFAVYNSNDVMYYLKEVEYKTAKTQRILIDNGGNKNITYKAFVLTSDSFAPLGNAVKLKIE